MRINRIIWLFFFMVGAIILALFTAAVDSWAFRTAIPGTEMYCRGTLVVSIPLTRAPLCFAVGFVEAKTWVFYARDILLEPQFGLDVSHLLRTADVALYVAGAFAFAVALGCLWATAMTGLVLSTVAGSYTLMHGLSSILGGRRAA